MIKKLFKSGLEYFTKEEKIDEKTIRVKIWDTAGQEQFKSLTRNFYKNSHGVLICYDVTNRKSFEKIQEWVDSIADNASANIKMVLVGNKIDLTRDVTKDEGKKLAQSYNIPFFETSAKTDEGINECIRKLITDIISDFKPHDEGIKIDTKPDSKKNCAC